MKKSLIIGLLGLAATVAPSFGQGVIFLDNYFSYGQIVKYGDNVPANGVSGGLGTPGAGLNSSWTAGLYWAPGNILGSLTPDSTPYTNGVPTAQNAAFQLATGGGSTAQFAGINIGGASGQFAAGSVYTTTGVAAGGTITVEVIAFNTADGSYANANWRGHSAAFTMTVSDSSSPTPNAVGSFMPSFAVNVVPEPSTFALTGLGAAALMIFRRKK